MTTAPVTFAPDLSADLGFGRSMPPRFWAWCDRWGLPRCQRWPREQAEEALRRAGVLK